MGGGGEARRKCEWEDMLRRIEAAGAAETKEKEAALAIALGGKEAKEAQQWRRKGRCCSGGCAISTAAMR